MIPADRTRLREDFASTAPEVKFSIRFHGTGPAPSVPPRGSGHFAFRTWGQVYVTISPDRPLTISEHARFMEVVQRWKATSGFSISTGPNDSWPVVQD